MAEPVCLCSECKEGIYNPNDYYLTSQDFDNLRIENRKLGLSGHLRVKNEAATVKQCVESVISVVDELIITYQPSKDSTEFILKELACKYKNKIKLFLYEPHVVSQHISNEYPDSSSIHNLANYYNYGYTKISYKYYMKIDGDQVYFSDKLFKIKRKLIFWDKLKYIFPPSRILVRFLSKIMQFCLKYSFLDRNIVTFNLLKQKFALSLGGINIVLKNNRLYMPLSPPPPLYGIIYF